VVSVTGRRPAGAAVGAVLDRLLGEPTGVPHPVAVFGTAMTRVEADIYAPTFKRGAIYAGIGTGLGLVVGLIGRSTAVATYVAVAGRSLGETALGVEAALHDGGLERAREELPSLVGRDPSGLDEAEIVRAVVESVAENTVDAVIAPLLWAALAGAPGVLAYRAVNTMDAMVGHRSERYERFGTASARLDDVANWVPARITALLVVAARPRSAGDVWRAVTLDAPAHPSPNSGVAEAAFAAALGIRLGGISVYGDRVEDRPILGTGRPAAEGDVAAAVKLSSDVSTVLTALLLVPAALGAVRRIVRGSRVSARAKRATS